MSGRAADADAAIRNAADRPGPRRRKRPASRRQWLLRADYTGAPIQLTNPTVDEFFNVNAFTIPPPGQYGDSSRNTIVGPGARQLNALFQRDVRLTPNRTLTLQVNALNLLNTVQWASVDTNINSATFGSVLSAKPMRTVTLTARMRF